MEKKWYGTHTCKSDGRSNQIAEQLMAIFTKSGHSVLLSALNLGTLKGKGGG